MTALLCKTCTSCNEEKPVEDFHLKRGGRLGRHSRCKPCANQATAASRKKNGTKSKNKTPEQARESNLRRAYGITGQQYDAMVQAQGGCCAICQQPPSGSGMAARLHVDHCHVKGAVRSLLCQRCNLGLGYFVDDPALLGRAIDYLKEHSG